MSRRRNRVIVTIIASALLLAACGRSVPGVPTGTHGPGTSGSGTPTTACAGTTQTAHRNLVYAQTSEAPDLTSLDIYQVTRPSGCGPAPILFWVHGGGWQKGDKANQLTDKMSLSLQHGWTLVSVNYRLAPAVHYPVPNQDVADAVAWTLAHASTYGADPARVAIMGHSAGGGIVAAVTTDQRYLNDAGRQLSSIDCAVSLDTDGYDISKKADDGGIYDAMFGTDPSKFADESPIDHIAANKGIPAYFIVTRGTAQRKADAHAYAAKLTAAGVSVKIIETPSLDHNGVNDAVGKPGDTLITPDLVTFLNSCFQP